MIETFLICIIASTLQCNTLHPDLNQFIPDYDKIPGLKDAEYSTIPVPGLPEVGHWTNCARLVDICEFPELEQYDLSDILVYRFENGTMIGLYVGEAPISK